MDNMDFKNKESYIRGYRRKGGIIIDDYNIDIESINAFLENFCIKTNMSKIDCLDGETLKIIL